MKNLSRNEKKLALRELIGKTERTESYSITILKVADKRVTFDESINGLSHVHSWFEIEDAYDYYYYKLQLNRFLSSKRKEIDMSKASSVFKNQKAAYDDITNEVRTFLFDNIICWDERDKPIIEWKSERLVEILYNNVTITIALRKPTDNFLFISMSNHTNVVLDTLEAAPYVTFGRLQEDNISNENSELSGTALFTLLHRYGEIRAQLNKFLTMQPIEEVFPVSNDDIIEFVANADDGKTMQIELNAYTKQRRYLAIERKSRIKYLIEVRNETTVVSEDTMSESIKMQEEFWININKFSSDYTSNIEKIKRIYNALV